MLKFYLILSLILSIIIIIFLKVKFNNKENWDFLTHSTISLNKKRFEKLIWEDQALLPNPENKLNWINIIQSEVIESNLSQELKDIVLNFDVNTPLVKMFIQYPSLKSLFTPKLISKLFNNDLMFPAVYIQYIFQDMHFEGKGWYYSNDIIFIFDTELLKNLPFVVCKGVVYGSCIYQLEKDNIDGFYGRGNYKEKPNMDKVQNMINDEIRKNKEYNQEMIEKIKKELKEEESKKEPNPLFLREMKEEIDGYEDDFNLFKFSHEVLFDKIPISYTKAIITTNEDKKNWIQEIVKPLDIPVYFISENEIEFSKLK